MEARCGRPKWRQDVGDLNGGKSSTLAGVKSSVMGLLRDEYIQVKLINITIQFLVLMYQIHG